jgi:hypothetical protein
MDILSSDWPGKPIAETIKIDHCSAFDGYPGSPAFSMMFALGTPIENASILPGKPYRTFGKNASVP